MRPAARSPEELIEHARERAEPDAGEAGRVLARLRAQISVTSTDGERPLAGVDPPLDVADRARGVAHWRLAPGLRRALLGGAGVVLFGAGFLLGRFSAAPSATPAPAVVSARVAQHALASSETRDAPNATAPATPGTAPLPALTRGSAPNAASTASSAAASTSNAKGSRATHPRARSHALPQPTNEPLKEALRRLRLAQRALYDRDAARALAILDDLDRRIAPAVLGEERELTRILALCGTGEPAEARALAERWSAEHPQSIYLARLQNSCVEPARARDTE